MAFHPPQPAGQSGRLIWIDLEMTGLDTGADSILEIATVVTDAQLEVLAEGPELAIGHPLAAGIGFHIPALPDPSLAEGWQALCRFASRSAGAIHRQRLVGLSIGGVCQMDLRDGNRNSRRFAVGKGVGRVLFKLFHLETHFLRRHYPDRFNGRGRR